ncbi:hypothetical protein SY89_03446 [Halolamina pelagica]|uniref:ABC transporter ATP-binding protein n=1 Tax=Halolamina pelagica TaxID=699431 RepID=A0A0P7G7L2_9EURY|nr:hypothetical protein SY89_03446 [Halolamina pelagica]
MDTGFRSQADAEVSVADEPIAIQTTGLTKRYGEDVLAVDGVDLTVYEGRYSASSAPTAPASPPRST